LASPLAVNHYEAAAKSKKKNFKGRFGNVTRAYYAVYLPNPAFRPPILPTPVSSSSLKQPSATGSKVFPGENIEESNELACKKTKVEVVKDPNVFESKKYPGKFYRVNKTSGATEWL